MSPVPVKHPYNPWYKATYTAEAAGQRLQLRVPSDVFSTQRIDEGTLLLLENLAAGTPATILDVGCGYGALGLPVAARFPQAKVEMIDRDLLAAFWSADNARTNGLANVDAHGSLGFRDVRAPGYDWILCNVPARIGRPFIRRLVEEGCTRLHAGGDLRLVVINDLATVLRELADEHGWPMNEIKRGPRHTILAFSPSTDAPAAGATDRELYTRDTVEIAGVRVSRPFDLGGDDPKRLTQGLPVLLDSLPRDPAKKFPRILTFRIGYGLLPILCRQRWPGSHVVAMDRDLLGTTFARLNAEDLDVAGERFEVRETAHFPDAIREGEKFDLILGEFSPSAGEGVAQAEMRALAASLAPGGQGYLLCLDKIEKDWVRPFATRQKLPLIATIKRAGYTVLRLA